MDKSIGAAIRARSKWAITMRAGGAFFAVAGLSLMLAACGGPSSSGVAQLGTTTTLVSSSSHSSTASTQIRDALAFARCMRSHGVLNYPDPNSAGGLPKVGPQQLDVSTTQFQAAQTACKSRLPSSGQSSQAWDQQTMNALWKFARCVRSHGVPNWPDPLAESDPGQVGTPGFPRTLQGIDTNSPQVKDAMNACQHLIPGYSSGGYP
jgi:hypothetical protein